MKYNKIKCKLNKVISGFALISMVCTIMTPISALAEDTQEQAQEVGEEKKITHGTATEWITEDMVNNTPPTDYAVNKATQGDAQNGAYNAYFLEDEIQTVYIEIEENNLNYLLQNAIDESYVMATSVTIGDVTLGYPGLRTKGSYTLEHSVTENEGSDRFSFTINFGKYIKKKDYGSKQNFFGCDKISFNNFFFDKTMMKKFGIYLFAVYDDAIRIADSQLLEVLESGRSRKECFHIASLDILQQNLFYDIFLKVGLQIIVKEGKYHFGVSE